MLKRKQQSIIDKRKKTERFQSFEETLKLLLLKKCDQGAVSFHTLFKTLSGKGRILLLLLFSLPFSQIFGLAVVFGLIIAYLGISLAFKLPFWIPKKLADKKIKGKIFKKIIGQVYKFFRKIKSFTHPRMIFLSQNPTMRIINGLLIAIIGISIALSWPIPLSGFISYGAIFFMAIGLLNDDGVLIAISYPLSLLYIAFVILTLKEISLSQIFSFL